MKRRVVSGFSGNDTHMWCGISGQCSLCSGSDGDDGGE